MGGIPTNLSGDFLQLPPVEAPSLASPENNSDLQRAFEPDGGTESKGPAAQRDRREFERKQGLELWRTAFTTVTNLNLNMRTTGVLAEILNGMRRGKITDDLWKALEERLVNHSRDDDGKLRRHKATDTADPRLTSPPFSTNTVTYIVHRHQLRVAQSFTNAIRESLRLKKRLYVSVAHDVIKGDKSRDPNSPRLLDLLRECNLRKVKNLPSTLPLVVGMRLLLCDKICARLQLMNGCECILEEILFDGQEQLPTAVPAGEPILLTYMPTHLLLRATDVRWTLPDDQLPPLPDTMPRQGLFLLPRAHDYFTSIGPEKQSDRLEVHRVHFKVIPADTRIVYGAQGQATGTHSPDRTQGPVGATRHRGPMHVRSGS